MIMVFCRSSEEQQIVASTAVEEEAERQFDQLSIQPSTSFNVHKRCVVYIDIGFVPTHLLEKLGVAGEHFQGFIVACYSEVSIHYMYCIRPYK